MTHKKYVFIQMKGHCISRYEPVHLYAYLVMSRKFVDPLTKEPLTLATLNTIDKLVCKKSTKKTQLLTRLHTEKSDYDDTLLLCMGLDRQMGNIITHILNVLDYPTIHDDVYNNAYNVHSYDFKYLFESLYSIDSEYAQNAVRDIFDTYSNAYCPVKQLNCSSVFNRFDLYKYYYRLLKMCAQIC